MALPLIGALVAPAIKALFSIVDKTVEDKDQRNNIKAALQSQFMEGNLKELDAAMQVIVAEAQGGSWIQRSWRPITMLTFVALIVAKWLGFTAPGISSEVELALLDIVKIGLGGYVVGRSAEKVARIWREKG